MKNKFGLFLQRVNPFKTPGQIFVIDPTARKVVFKILKPIELYYTEVFEEKDVEPRVRPVVVKPTDDGTVAFSMVDNFYVGKVNIPYGTNIKEFRTDDKKFFMKTSNVEFEVDVYLSPSSMVVYVKMGQVEIVGLEY